MPNTTKLQISIRNAAGAIITNVIEGETIYILSKLTDTTTSTSIPNATIFLVVNGTTTNKSCQTNTNGICYIPYTLTGIDIPTVTFQTIYGGT